MLNNKIQDSSEGYTLNLEDTDVCDRMFNDFDNVYDARNI